MHEQSLLRSVLEHSDAIRRKHHASRIKEVRVEVGALAGVDPTLLASAFHRVESGDFPIPESLVIDEVPLTGVCSACDDEHTMEDFRPDCPACGAWLRFVRGDAFRLISVTLVDARNEGPTLSSEGPVGREESTRG